MIPRNSYLNAGGCRCFDPEITAHIAERTGSTTVMGFAEMIRSGDAIRGGARQSGFHECHRPEEWHLSLSAKAGLSMKTAPVPKEPLDHVAFALCLGFGNGSPLPQPSGQWDVLVNDRLAVSVRVVNHSQVWRQNGCALAFAANRIETAEPYAGLTLSSVLTDEAFAAFGPALLVVPTAWLTPGQPAVIRLEPRGDVNSTRWIQVNRVPNVLRQTDIYRVIEQLTGDWRPTAGDYQTFFGDIHTHSGETAPDPGREGCGLGSREANYAYARNAAGLDFYALTDHEWQIGVDGVDQYLGLADSHNRPGEFVCIPAFEHTNGCYGHRNVYYRSSGGIVVPAARDWTHDYCNPEKACRPDQLWSELDANGVPFMTVPHHPSAASHPCTWDFFSETHDRLVEVYSVWGSSEYYGDFPRGVSDRYDSLDVRAAIRRGHRFGIIASADGHDGHPGNANGPGIKHPHQYHFCGSGRAAVLTTELTREAVFDALHERRCYGTTGTPIGLDVSLNGALMGSHLPQLPGNGTPVVRVRAAGTNGIDHIRIVKNARVVATIPCHNEPTCEAEWADPAFDPAAPNSYYVRIVQRDRESAWSSPIWVG